MEPSKQHSLLSLIFILNCLPKSSVIRIKVIIIMMMILIKLIIIIIIIIIIIRLRENGKKAIRLIQRGKTLSVQCETKVWFSYVGRIPDDRGFYFLPTVPDMSD